MTPTTSKRNDSQAPVTKQKQEPRLPPGVSKLDYHVRHQPKCRACSGPLPRPVAHHKGRRHTTCSPACRQAAYRRRRLGLPENTPRGTSLYRRAYRNKLKGVTQ